MANCSIPNSSPVSGRISTGSLRRSKEASKSRISLSLLSQHCAPQQTLNAEHRISNIELDKQQHAGVRCSASDVRCSMFAFLRRVKGAWWPSRSSKPSSLRKWRGRFDSYPLRLFIFDFRLPIADCPGSGQVILSIVNWNSKIENRTKGGEPHVA